MQFTLPSRLIGSVMAAALALTALTAAPAQADRDRTARIAATVLGLAVAGAIIHDRNKDKRQKAYTAPPQRIAPQKHGVHQNRSVNHNRGYVQPRPLPQRVNRNALPQSCLRSYRTRQGQGHMFGRRCLEQNYRAASRLPQNCAIQIRTDRGVRAGYDARCLQRSGYSLRRG